MKTGNYDNGDNEFGEPEIVRKLFIGGLNYKTDDESLKQFFEQWGEIVDVVVMKDPQTKRSRGFGFVTYSRASMVDEAQRNRPHKIDGREVETKRAVSRGEIKKPEASVTVKKLFIGGIKDNHTDEMLKDYFSQYGSVKNITIATDKATGRKRGFAFIEFDDYDPVDKICLENPHTIGGFQVDVKKALARTGGQGGGRDGEYGRGGGGGGGWQGNRGGGGGDWGNSGYGNQQAAGGWQSNPWDQSQSGGWDNQAVAQDSWGGQQGGWGGQDSYGGGYQQQQGYSGGPVRSNYNSNRSTPYQAGGASGGGYQKRY